MCSSDLFKMYHCLEHRRRGAGWEIIRSVPARWVAVSFPTRNLSARAVDILGNYEPAIRAGAEKQGWAVQSFSVPSETVLVIRKS